MVRYKKNMKDVCFWNYEKVDHIIVQCTYFIQSLISDFLKNPDLILIINDGISIMHSSPCMD